MANEAIAGIIDLDINGTRHLLSGDFTYNLGIPKRETLLGVDKPHGFKLVPQVAHISGEIRDSKSLVLSDFVQLKNASMTLSLANGKTIVGSDMYFAGEGTPETGEAKLEVVFHGDVEELKAA